MVVGGIRVRVWTAHCVLIPKCLADGGDDGDDGDEHWHTNTRAHSRTQKKTVT